MSVIDCCTREIVSWNLSNSCRTDEALAAVEQAVLERLPAGSREVGLTLTTDNGTQFTSTRFVEMLTARGLTVHVTELTSDPAGSFSGCSARWGTSASTG